MSVHRTERVFTNLSCNQNCAFCDTRRPSDERAFVALPAVLTRIDAVAEAKTIVLTGGEPARRKDLPAVVRHAKRTGATVVLETNGALLDDARIAALAEAGLDEARVHLPGWGDECDAVTRDPGGFDATRTAIDALRTEGIPLSIATPIVAANADAVPAMAEHLAPLQPIAWILGAPNEGEGVLPLPEAARVIERAEAAARRVDLTLRLAPHTHVPPCLFEHPARVAHLFSLTPGGADRPGHARPTECSGCAIADRCPGLPDAAAGTPVRPLAEDRVRRRLSLISTVEDQIARELYQDEITRRPGLPPQPVRTVRIGFRCNQACDFCFVSTHLPAAERADVEAAITEAAREGAHLVISGGEPTLDPSVAEYVALAKREGATFVELQTNATRLGAKVPVAPLVDAGVDLFFVSLHGASAEVSDTVTGAPGTHVKTLAGIDAIHASEGALRLNFVFCETNRHEFPRYIDMVAERWPGTNVSVSFVAPSTDMVPRTAALIPRYTDVVPALAEGIRRAHAKGLPLSGFDSMCGLPLCLVPDDLGEFFELPEAPEGYGRGETFYAEPCQRCDLAGRCFGLRQGYAVLHGTDELKPVRA